MGGRLLFVLCGHAAVSSGVHAWVVCWAKTRGVFAHSWLQAHSTPSQRKVWFSVAHSQQEAVWQVSFLDGVY